MPKAELRDARKAPQREARTGNGVDPSPRSLDELMAVALLVLLGASGILIAWVLLGT